MHVSFPFFNTTNKNIMFFSLKLKALWLSKSFMSSPSFIFMDITWEVPICIVYSLIPLSLFLQCTLGVILTKVRVAASGFGIVSQVGRRGGVRGGWGTAGRSGGETNKWKKRKFAGCVRGGNRAVITERFPAAFLKRWCDVGKPVVVWANPRCKDLLNSFPSH